MVGSLMYVMIATRPDLATAVGIVSKYLDKPKKAHCELVKHIYKYLRTNTNYQLIYKTTDNDITLSGYVDAGYANVDKFHSTSGYAFMVNDNLISWYSGKQSVTAQSTAEAEYYAAVKGANECIWIKQLLNELGFPQGTIPIYEDNQACIALSKNPEDHKRTNTFNLNIISYVNMLQIKN
jgi:hypothetical protein